MDNTKTIEEINKTMNRFFKKIKFALSWIRLFVKKEKRLQ